MTVPRGVDRPFLGLGRSEDVSRRARAARRRLPRWLSVPCWVVVGLLGVVAVARLVAWDSIEPLAVADAFTVVIFLPAWLITLLGAAGRRYFLALAGLLLVGAQVAFVVPELAAAKTIPRWSLSAPHVRLLDGNLSDSNPSMAGYAHQIVTERPDLVAFEEASPFDAADLQRSGALSGLAYRFEVARLDPWAFLIASRYPLGPTKVVSLYDRPLVVETVVHLPTGPLALWVVHTVAPLPSSWGQWAHQLRLIAGLVARRGSRRLLLVGDFNATWGNKAFDGILHEGLTDAAAARGEPFAMTWSQSIPPLPPLVRIDHVLTGPGLVVTSIRAQDGPGSDHRDELATIAVRSPPLRR